MNEKIYDLIVVGTGAAGLIAAIVAARENRSVLLLEKLPKIASKLKATGGGRCNLTNTLSNEAFMEKFGRDGRFMQDALAHFDHKKLTTFMQEIGVETHAPDGFRIFPTSHSSATIIAAFELEIQKRGVELLCDQKVEEILTEDGKVTGVRTKNEQFLCQNLIIATGGLGYPTLGAEGDGYALASKLGHSITELSPAMMPLKTQQTWVANCKADTIAKVELRVNIKKYSKLRAKGDLIFTNNGIRGPVVLDFAREVTPLLAKYGKVPLLLNLTKGKNENELLEHLKKESQKDPSKNTLELIKTLLAEPLSREICTLAEVAFDARFSKLEGAKRARLISLLAWTPLDVIGHDGFKMAMITRGGISLKEIDPKTMQSRLIKGLYFCGEVMNLDGPCGGYNLQWSFASGALAGRLL